MAEVVGLLASGISIGSLAAQIGSSILKLKCYCDEIQEAPEVVRDLLENIEDLYSILADIEDDQIRNPVSALLLDGRSRNRCLTHCQKAAFRLEELVNDIRVDIDSSKQLRKRWAASKVVLRKEKLDRYRDKLERTVRLLALSEQCYTRLESLSYHIPLCIRRSFLL